MIYCISQIIIRLFTITKHAMTTTPNQVYLVLLRATSINGKNRHYFEKEF